MAELRKVYKASLVGERDAVYALPIGLIDRIKGEIPTFFSPREELFERDFARLAGAGQTNGQVFWFEGFPKRELQPAERRAQQLFNKEWAKIAPRLREMEYDGLNPVEIEYFRRRAAGLRQAVDQRELGYVGWLITNPRFRKERDTLFSRWREYVEYRGFPRAPISGPWRRLRAPEPLYMPILTEFWRFYFNWCLEGLATWDLPVPLRSTIAEPAKYDLGTVGGGGFLCFVPWFLLRDKKFTLHDLAKQWQFPKNVPRLEEWLTGGKRILGYERSAVVVKLYVWLELAIKRRYSDRIRGNVDRLDHAFANYLASEAAGKSAGDAESIRKLRQYIAQRLRLTAD